MTASDNAGAPAARPETALAAAGAAGVLLIVALVGAAAAALAPDSGALVIHAIAAWAAGLGGLVMVLVAWRGGDRGLALAADAFALALIAGQLALGGAAPELVLGALVAPVVHAAVFQSAGRVAGVVVAAIGLGAAGATVGGGGLEPLWWTLPGILAAGLASLPMSALREQRRALELTEAEARQLADEDGLTGLANYRAFWRTLNAEVARSERHHQPFSVIVLDLDDFKRVNDEHGHLVGDAALRTVAAALRRAVRAEDVVCRQGGDEFAVIAVAAGTGEAPCLARRLVEAVTRGSSAPPVPSPLSASAGWATFGEPACAARDLMEHAQAALRGAKQERGGPRPERRAPGAARSAGASALRVQAPSAVSGPRPGLRLAVLGNLARALTGATTERGIAETASAHVAGAVDADRVAIVRRARGDGSVALVAVSGGRGLTEVVAPDAKPPLSTAMAERRAVTASRPPRAAGKPVTVLALPLIAGEGVWGALELESNRDGAFGAEEVELLESMGEIVGRSLAVAQMLAEVADSAAHGESDREAALRRSDDHGRAVARLAEQVGRRLGLAGVHLRQLYLAALFHDIGTLCAPPTVLRKEGHLTDEEFAALRPHPLVGQRLLRGLPGLAPAADIVRALRERWDGAGYPDGLAGEEIPLAARILHACDAFVAMTTARPYRSSLSSTVAVEELRRNSGSQFDPAVVAALIDAVEVAAPAEAGVG